MSTHRCFAILFLPYPVAATDDGTQDAGDSIAGYYVDIDAAE